MRLLRQMKENSVCAGLFDLGQGVCLRQNLKFIVVAFEEFCAKDTGSLFTKDVFVLKLELL